MVRLLNILQFGNEISCDYAPETSDEIGHVVMDAISFEIKDVKYSGYEHGKKMYVSHVRSKLKELLISKEPIPKETFAIWY